MSQRLEQKRILVLVRTYPTPSMSGVEVSCTAGLTSDGEWIRLFPVPYHFLDTDQRFRKYQWIQARIRKGSDPRHESRRLKVDSVEVVTEPLPTAHAWKARKDLVYPHAASGLCELGRRRDSDGFPTIGFFKPRLIKRLVIEPEDASWTQDQLQALGQGRLFDKGPAAILEKVPFKAKYEFVCQDSGCGGHSLMCTDWEMGQAWRSWRDKYGEHAWEEHFRGKFWNELALTKDLHFFVGTVANHPNRWIIIGLFYPPLPHSTPLLDGLE